MKDDGFEKRLLDALRLSLEMEHSAVKETCGQYGLSTFDLYCEGLLKGPEARELEAHCLDCPRCMFGLASALSLHEKVEGLDGGMRDDMLVEAAMALFEKREETEETRWAAAEGWQGGQGLALGVAYALDVDQVALIECSAWVGEVGRMSPKLELLGRQCEGDRKGGLNTGPLTYLEEKLEQVFRSNKLLKAFCLDRRHINVDLKERVLSEAGSLSLAIVMAIVNAIHQSVDDPPRVYSADLRQDGKLQKVGRLAEKIEGVRKCGIGSFVLSEENRADCPKEFQEDPDLSIEFFDSLDEVLSFYRLLPVENRSAVAPSLHSLPREAGIGESVGKAGSSAAPVCRADDDRSFVLEALGSCGVAEEGLPEALLEILEDACEMRHEGRGPGTVIFLGSENRVETILPDGGFDFSRERSLREGPEPLLSLCSIVNGRELGFEVGTDGRLRSIRRVNIAVLDRPEVSALLIGEDRRFASLSLISGSLVFFLPPVGRRLHVFFEGRLLGKYQNGRWRRTDYAGMERMLEEIAERSALDVSTVNKAACALLALAERGHGGTIAFLRGSLDSDVDVEQRLDSELGLRLRQIAVRLLAVDDLANLAKEDGALLIDRSDHLVACCAYFLVDAPHSSRGRPGTGRRHLCAQEFSRIADTAVLVASRYGVVTLYHRGEELVRL